MERNYGRKLQQQWHVMALTQCLCFWAHTTMAVLYDEPIDVIAMHPTPFTCMAQRSHARDMQFMTIQLLGSAATTTTRSACFCSLHSSVCWQVMPRPLTSTSWWHDTGQTIVEGSVLLLRRTASQRMLSGAKVTWRPGRQTTGGTRRVAAPTFAYVSGGPWCDMLMCGCLCCNWKALVRYADVWLVAAGRVTHVVAVLRHQIRCMMHDRHKGSRSLFMSM